MAYDTEFPIPDEIDPEEAFDRLAAIREDVQRAVAGGEFDRATSIVANAVGWAQTLVSASTNPDVILPVNAQIVALAADAVVVGTVAADIEAASEGLGLLSKAAEGLQGLFSDGNFTASLIPCEHNRPSYTGMCRKRPPCPSPGT